jgi:hypothetical protein
MIEWVQIIQYELQFVLYTEEYNVENYQILMDCEEFFAPEENQIQKKEMFINEITLSKNVISSIEGNCVFWPVVSRILTSFTVVVIRFFFIIPGDFEDRIDRLFEGGWDISSLVVVDDTTVNDGVDEVVLLTIKRGIVLDTTEFIGEVDVSDEDKISEIEIVRSFEKDNQNLEVFYV